jgi:flagellar biosynthesis activator protein FlaF
MSFQAYQTAQKHAETPRDQEYRLFGQVTRALVEADAAGRDAISQRIDALDWNRRMWTALATDCSFSENGLPQSLRAQIISLSLFVSRYSSDVMRDGADMAPLIDINKMIMEGLRPPAAANDSIAALAAAGR